MHRGRSFVKGMVRVSPLMLGVIPFGMICGANAIDAGLSPADAVMMSVVVFAGASQLAVTQLMAMDASWTVMLITGVVINLRMLMYSASLSRYLGTSPMYGRMGIAYLLTDQAYATSLQEFGSGSKEETHQAMFYFGVALLMWIAFVGATGAGAVLGAVIPPEWDLGFSVPLTFLAMLMSSMKRPDNRKAAVIAGVCALLLHGLTCNLGMLIGAVAGIVGGHLMNQSDGKAKA